MKIKSLLLSFVTVFFLTSIDNTLASVKMQICNENKFDIRWAFVALNGGLFGAPNSIKDAVGAWGDGYYAVSPGECKTSSFEIGAEKVYFVFLTYEKKPRFLKLNLTGPKSVIDKNPIREMCIPLDGEHFYYELKASNYKNGKVQNCPRKVSKAGKDYFKTQSSRAMGIADISSGIRAVGENFLTITIPKIDGAALYELRDAKVMAAPKKKSVPIEYLVKIKKRVENDSIIYGTSNWIDPQKHKDYGINVNSKYLVYSLSEDGRFSIQTDGENNNLEVSFEGIYSVLNRGKKIQVQQVTVNGKQKGFYVFNPWAAQGFYLDSNAFDPNKMSSKTRKLLFSNN